MVCCFLCKMCSLLGQLPSELLTVIFSYSSLSDLSAILQLNRFFTQCRNNSSIWQNHPIHLDKVCKSQIDSAYHAFREAYKKYSVVLSVSLQFNDLPQWIKNALPKLRNVVSTSFTTSQLIADHCHSAEIVELFLGTEPISRHAELFNHFLRNQVNLKQLTLSGCLSQSDVDVLNER